MALYYKVDILGKLKSAGYSTYKLRKEKIFGESTIQRFRAGDPLEWPVLDKLCSLLGCQPGDLIGHEPDAQKSPEE